MPGTVTSLHNELVHSHHTELLPSVLLGPEIIHQNSRSINFCNQRVFILFLFLCENICVWYSLKVPQEVASNEYQQ